jgi:hypothetical protein
VTTTRKVHIRNESVEKVQAHYFWKTRTQQKQILTTQK